MTARWRSVGLGLLILVVNVLVVATVAISVSQRGFAGWWATLRGDWVPLEDALAVDDPFDGSAVTTAPPDSTSATTASPRGTEAPTDEPEAPSAADLYAQGEDLTVLVLGDLTGVHENDWPAAWGRMLSADRSVEIFPPLASDPTQYSDPLELGDGEATVSLYNASYSDGTPSYAAARLPLLAPDEPDVILLNFGRSNTPENLPDELSDLWGAVNDTFPEAESYVVVAPPRLDGAEPTTDVTRRWAQEVNASLIDVAQVFEDEDLTISTRSGRDPLAVNIFGNERWAEVVHSAVFQASFGPAQDQVEISPSALEQDEAATLPPVQPVEPTYSDPPYVPPPATPPYEPPVPSGPAPVPAPPPLPPEEPEPTLPAPTEPEPTPPAPTEPIPTDPPGAGDRHGQGASALSQPFARV